MVNLTNPIHSPYNFNTRLNFGFVISNRKEKKYQKSFFPYHIKKNFANHTNSLV